MKAIGFSCIYKRTNLFLADLSQGLSKKNKKAMVIKKALTTIDELLGRLPLIKNFGMTIEIVTEKRV